MFTNEELFEYFSDRYTREQVMIALEKLGIDPNSEEFPASTTDHVEQVFAVISDAKQLAGTSDLAQVEQTATQLASDRAVSIPVDSFKGLIEILDAQAAVEAVALFQRRKSVREGILNQLETNALANANQTAAKRMDALNRLCSDPEVLDQILQDYGLLTVTQAEKQHSQLTDSTPEFDVDQYLSEVNGEKKTPSTVSGTRQIAKKLITQSLL